MNSQPDLAIVFPVLETESLLLREFSLKDALAVFEMYKRADINKWLSHEPMQSFQEAEQRVRSRIGLFEHGLGYRWAITLKDTPENVIGSCGYFHVRIGTQTYEIGYEIHPDHWHKGFMAEALTAMINYSFGDSTPKPVHRFEALVDPRNEASIRLLEKLGFQKEGTRREFGYWKGKFQDVLLFALLKDEWKRNSSRQSAIR
jgi:ribosomal-protein-alanine N-acetyltransferase